MITDAKARWIAYDWHGGGGSALYALCSTGAIDTARSDHNVAAEIQDDINSCVSQGARWQARNLNMLLHYVNHHGPRGTVDGWGDMLW